MNAEDIRSDGGSRRLALFLDVGRLVVSAKGLQETLAAIVTRTRAYFGPLEVSVSLAGENSEEMSSSPVLGNLLSSPGAATSLGQGPAGRAEGGAAGSEAVLSVPIKGRETVLGFIRLANAAGQRLDEEEGSTLAVLAGYLAIAIDNARLSISDHCTGLFNANHLNHVLEAELSRSQRFGHEFSMVFMDLDYFKTVNDTCGHLLGSKLLGMVGELVRSRLRQTDSAFRYGGDEFVLLLPEASKHNAIAMVKRLQEALNSRQFDLGEGRCVRMTASYGIASFPADGATAQDLLRVADETMYRIKSTMRNGIAVAGQE